MQRIFRYLEPSFFAGLIDDPCLIVRDRPIHRSVMVDCGALHHIAKRELKPVGAIFISHAHMDHLMGFDPFLRQVHASPRTVQIFGPPGMADRIAAHLSGYDWNLAEPYWCTLQVHDVHPDRLQTSTFSGPHRFRRQDGETSPRQGPVIYLHNHIQVAAEQLDHGIPVLAFRMQESKIFMVEMERLKARGLVAGAWLVELKRRFFNDWTTDGPLAVTETGGEFTVNDTRGLYEELRGPMTATSLGYLTDCGYSPENRQRIESFLKGVTLLVGECAFLKRHRHKARSSRHLCTDDWNELLELLKPRFFLPMHFSKTYLGTCHELYEELSPPPETTILRLPQHRTPRPIFAREACTL